MSDLPSPITSSLLDLPGIRHGFFTRHGGVSGGLYASLNSAYSSHDARENVAANRQRALGVLGDGLSLVTLSQVHSPTAHIVGPEGLPPTAVVSGGAQGDGMATATRGIALGIQAADCAPILLADPVAQVIGAAHAGWKPAFTGIVESTLAAMVSLGAERSRVVASIGPCIAQASYEVDDGFYARFCDTEAGFSRFFAAGKVGHWQFDLKGFVAFRLAEAGVAQVDVLPHDTYADEGRFFSYRRMTHRGEADYGRLISIIALS